MPRTERRPYHHGDLRRALLDATAEAIAEAGPVGCSLRDIARRAGVSHAAPAHHFGDKTGLLTAFATEGFEGLAAALRAASSKGLLEVGVAYVCFAHANRAPFEVMFRRDLLDMTDPALLEAMAAANAPLRDGLSAEVAALSAAAEGEVPASVTAPDPATVLDVEALAIGAWAQMHGLATLLVNGNLPASVDDPAELARRVSRALDAAAILGRPDAQ